MEELISSIKSYIAVSEELKKELGRSFKLKTFKKKEILLNQGGYNSALFYAKKGIVRCFNLKEGKEITNNFFFEGTFFTDFKSLFQGVPISQNFQAIENVEIYYLSQDKLKSLAEVFPELKQWGGKMAEELFSKSIGIIADFKASNPEERYKLIMKEQPEIIKRIPLGYIASYIGITQVHLSRIRAKS